MNRPKNVIFWLLVGWVVYKLLDVVKIFFEIPPVPVLPDDEWWGAGSPSKLSQEIRPFKIQVSDEALTDLNNRLDRYIKMSKTPPLENTGFRYGFNTKYLQTVVKYWRNNYNWRKSEKYLNKYPHFKTYINGLDIHFLHIKPEKSSGKTVLPLLLIHGWPGSIREFYELIPLLTKPKADSDFVFELVVPSLPGYGYSEGAKRPGLGAVQVAVLLKNLMERVGFNKFYVQGGDWGSILGRYLGILYPEKVLGVHANMCFALSFQTPLKWILGASLPFYSQEENHYDKMYPLVPKILFIMEELGYMHVHASKPDTTGTALEDSPVGLAAYILEKFSTWTNRTWRSLEDGGLTKKYTLDTLLDNVMIYWTTGTITTSMRLYAESFNATQILLGMEQIPLSVPTACARFPEEVFWLSKKLLEGIYVNLVQVSDFKDGGHFAALESPEVLNEDIWKAVKKFRQLQSHEK